MIESHINEKLLGDFLRERISGEWINNKKVTDSGINNRPDYRNEKYKLIVEFDGYRHYSSYSIIKDDRKKDKVYSDMGYTIIRLPYFIQLDGYVIKILFEKYTQDFSRYNNYPHGFISDLALLPVDFNKLGSKIYKNDLLKFKNIAKDIDNSYKHRL